MSSGGYQGALEAAGATVHTFDSFGDYQGSWFAKVTFNGVTGWVQGGYGSCSGCDAFEAEMGYEPYDVDDDDYAHYKASWDARLKNFGASYLNALQTFDEVFAPYKRKVEGPRLDYEWLDEDDRAIYDFLKENQ
jgi:hypothetical protein